MKISKFVLCLLIFVALCVVGCQDKKELIIGSWSSTAKSMLHGGHDIYSFEKDKFLENTRPPQSVSYETKDGKFFAHIDVASIEINFIDDNTIMLSAPLGRQIKCVRITNEEADAIRKERNKPAPQQAPSKNWLEYLDKPSGKSPK